MTCPCCHEIEGCGYCDDRETDVRESLLAQVEREGRRLRESGAVRVVMSIPDHREGKWQHPL